MGEPDDVERLVDEAESDARRLMPLGPRNTRLLARIVRELLALHPVGECEWICNGQASCSEGYVSCPQCKARAVRARLNAIARGEEA